jgi:hypothetical protein
MIYLWCISDKVVSDTTVYTQDQKIQYRPYLRRHLRKHEELLDADREHSLTQRLDTERGALERGGNARALFRGEDAGGAEGLHYLMGRKAEDCRDKDKTG